MTHEEKMTIVTDAAVERDGKKVLACKQAFMLSEEYGIPFGELSPLCNECGVKIVACQLGCFK